MGFDLRSVVFTTVLERMKKRAGSLRNMKRFKKCGIEGWLKVEVVAAPQRERAEDLQQGP
jgi:hypothetical protein